MSRFIGLHLTFFLIVFVSTACNFNGKGSSKNEGQNEIFTNGSGSDDNSNQQLANTDMLSFEGFIKERICYGVCGQFSASLFSTGKTKDMESRILKIKWVTITHDGKQNNCSYLHIVKEPGFETYTNIILGLGKNNSDCSSDQGCFGCADGKFRDVVKEIGYNGIIP